MAQLMRGDQLEPLISVERSQKRVGHVVLVQIAFLRFLNKCQGSFTNPPELREHLLFFPDQLRVERNRRLSTDQSGFEQNHRNMESPEKRRRFGRLIEQLNSTAIECPLD